MSNVGPLALVGGSEWQVGCEFDADLLRASGGNEVVVIPAAAAFEHPQRSLDRATAWFAELGATVRGLPVLARPDSENPELVDAVRNARFIYLADGSALHLRSVLKNSQLLVALNDAWHSGAVVAGSSAGATVLGDPMVDPRGGTFTLGLGLVRRLAFVPHWESWTDLRARRMGHLAPNATVVAEAEERTALIRWSDGTWQVSGAGKVELAVNRQPIDIADLETVIEIVAQPVPG